MQESREDDQHPFDDAISQQQIEAVIDWLGPKPRRVLELGCGIGRVLVPLVEAGHHVTGIERDPAALQSSAQRLAAVDPSRFTLIQADFTQRWPVAEATFHAVCCLGNTMMTLADVDDAVAVVAQAAARLVDGGAFIMDDCPGEYWPELTEGRWTSGISEDGQMQMIWQSDDAVFALRSGLEVDPECWTLTERDRPLRLWSMGELRLVARAAGLSAPARRTGESLLVMHAGRSGHE